MLQLSFVEFKKGAYILVDGAENSERFFIIQSGKVNCSNSLDPGKNATKILTTGDFVGVIPCMSCHSQIENAIALTDVKCISVPKGQYPELIAKNIPVALKIIRTFATRTREMNEQLTQLTLKNVSQDTPEHIFDVAQFMTKQAVRTLQRMPITDTLRNVRKAHTQHLRRSVLLHSSLHQRLSTLNLRKNLCAAIRRKL